MTRNKKTNSEFIIDALRSGEKLRSPVITQRVSEISGKKMKIQDIASILAKISDLGKCDLGFFIQKEKTHRGYTYALVPEALSMDPKHLYDLTRKTGLGRYTLEKAIEEKPSLKKHVNAWRLKSQALPSSYQRIHQTRAASSPKQSRTPRTYGKERTEKTIKSILSRILNEISEKGGLHLNVNLNISFSGDESN